MDGHGILGNKVWTPEGVLSFESPLDRQKFGAQVGPMTVFDSLSKRGLHSFNLSYFTQLHATVQAPVNLQTVVEAVSFEYLNLDSENIQGALKALSGRSPQEWPAFVWLHLVGFDAMSHHYGPTSREALEHLRHLDQELGALFSLLKYANTEKDGSTVRVALSADHGMVDIRQHWDLAQELSDRPEITVLPQSRLATLHFAAKDGNRESILKKLSNNPMAELVVDRIGTTLTFRRQGRHARFKLADQGCLGSRFALQIIETFRGAPRVICPSDAPLSGFNKAFPKRAAAYIEDIVAYFSSPNSPDAAVFAAEGVSFVSGELGGHGSLTEEELQVPLLTYQWPAVPSNRIPRNHELLAWLKLKSESDHLNWSLASAVAPSLDEATLVKKGGFLETALFLGAQSGGGPSVGMHLGGQTKLSRHWGLLGGYEFRSNEKVVSLLQHRFNVGAQYWLGDKSRVTLDSGLLQIGGLSQDSSGALGWCMSVNLSAQAKMFSVQDADLVLGASVGSIPVSFDSGFGTGFRAAGFLSWEQYLSFRDLAGVKLFVEQLALSNAQQLWAGLNIFYRFGN